MTAYEPRNERALPRGGINVAAFSALMATSAVIGSAIDGDLFSTPWLVIADVLFLGFYCFIPFLLYLGILRLASRFFSRAARVIAVVAAPLVYSPFLFPDQSGRWPEWESVVILVVPALVFGAVARLPGRARHSF